MNANRRKSWWWSIALLSLFVSGGVGLAPGAWAEGEATEQPGAPGGTEVAAVAPSPFPEPAVQGTLEGGPGESEEDDPWEPFNARMFTFNLQLDRYVLKPVATAWDTVVPDEVERGLGRMFANVVMPARFVNNLFQLKFDGAGRELARFVLNSTIGLAGFFDVAKMEGLEPSNEDTGQTLAVWGAGAGPYLVLPFLPPMTVRDGIGFGFDAALNPLTYFAPFAAAAGMKASEAVNSRALNLELFEDVEEGTLDMYSAVRNGYLQRRARAIQE